MADYIYLLQNRLTPTQWRALEAVREAARAHNMPVFLVGGAVRDLTIGSPVRDLDFAVQGSVRDLVADLEASGAVLAGENPAFSALYLTFRGGVRVELGPSLSVTFPKPGQVEAQPAGILDDLRHRDFTANAMAVSLNEGSYGLLLDPLNGIADIENRELRVVSPYGFIEEPALLLRAARLSERLGWVLESRTQSRYDSSKEEGHIQALPAFDRGYELEEILHEEDPGSILGRMEAEGWAGALFQGLRPQVIDEAGLDQVRDLMGQMEGLGLHADPSAVNFPLLTAKLGEGARQELKSILPRQGFIRQVETLEARSKELGAELGSKAMAQPSDAWKLLMNADPEVILYLALHSRAGAVQTRLKAFLKEWPQTRQRIPYTLMQEMRITPDLPGYDQLLDDLFFALIDNKLDTPEATRAFLEPFSPPAPPQVTVRRRPAKSVRGRGRKAVQEFSAEDTVEASNDAETAETARGEAQAQPAATPVAASVVKPALPKREGKPSKGSADSVPPMTPAPVTQTAGQPSGAKAAGEKASGEKPAAKAAGTAKSTAAKTSSAPPPSRAASPAKGKPAVASGSKAASGVKGAASAKPGTPPARVSDKATAGASSRLARTAAKTTPNGRSAGAGNVSGQKTGPGKPASKSGAPAKAAGKTVTPPRKAASPAPKKKAAAPAHKAPAKAALGKTSKPAAKAIAAKAPATKASAKGKTTSTAAGKKVAPANKKAAAKGRR